MRRGGAGVELLDAIADADVDAVPLPLARIAAFKALPLADGRVGLISAS